MKTDAQILICYNSPVSIFSVYNGKPFEKERSSNDLSERGFMKEINNIRQLLEENFTEVETLAINRNVRGTVNEINNYNPDIIFNFVESVEGISHYEYCMTGVYELLGFSYTGNVPACLGNCLHKGRTKNILQSLGINTPSFLIMNPEENIRVRNFQLKFPVILKLLNEDASIGISEYSVVDSLSKLKKQLGFLFLTYKQPVIIEEYIEGRELNVAILNNSVLPISEISFAGLPAELPKIVTYDGKWIEDSLYYANTQPVCPAKLSSRTKAIVEKAALEAFHAMNCRDYARVDIRLGKNNKPYVIEVNPNPDISSDSGFTRAAAAAGISHAGLLKNIAQFALERKVNDTAIKVS